MQNIAIDFKLMLKKINLDKYKPIITSILHFILIFKINSFVLQIDQVNGSLQI